jgi:hypothetical protein
MISNENLILDFCITIEENMNTEILQQVLADQKLMVARKIRGISHLF